MSKTNGRPMIEDSERPTCAKGHTMKRSGQNSAGQKRYYCAECRTYTPYVEVGPRYKMAEGFENFPLYALTGHFPRVEA